MNVIKAPLIFFDEILVDLQLLAIFFLNRFSRLLCSLPVFFRDASDEFPGPSAALEASE